MVRSSPRMLRRSSWIWKAMEEFLPNAARASSLGRRRLAHDGPHGQRGDAAVVAGLAQGHLQVVVGSEVVDVVAHPAHVQGLAFDGAGAHLPDGVEHRELGAVVQQRVAHHDGAHQTQSVVAGVDGQRLAVDDVRALLVAADQARVHDVVVDERGRVEELDGAPAGEGQPRIAAHRFAGQHGHGRPHPLAAPADELVQDVVEVAVERDCLPGTPDEVFVQTVVDLAADLAQVVDEEIDAHAPGSVRRDLTGARRRPAVLRR